MVWTNGQVVFEGIVRFKSPYRKRLRRFKRGYVVLTKEVLVVQSSKGGSVKGVIPMSHGRTAFHRSDPRRFEVGHADETVDAAVMWLFKAESDGEAEAWMRAIDEVIESVPEELDVFPGFAEPEAENVRIIRVSPDTIQVYGYADPECSAVIVHEAVRVEHVLKFRLTGTALMVRHTGVGVRKNEVISFVVHLSAAIGKRLMAKLRENVSSNLSKQVSIYAIALRPGGDLDKRLVIHPEQLLVERPEDGTRIKSQSMPASERIRIQQAHRTSAQKAIARATKKHTKAKSSALRSRGSSTPSSARRAAKAKAKAKRKGGKLKSQSSNNLAVPEDEYGGGAHSGSDSSFAFSEYDGRSEDGHLGATLGTTLDDSTMLDDADVSGVYANEDESEEEDGEVDFGDDDEFVVADKVVAGRDEWDTLLELDWEEVAELKRVAHDALAIATADGKTFVVYFEDENVFDMALSELNLILRSFATKESLQFSATIDEVIDGIMSSASAARISSASLAGKEEDSDESEMSSTDLGLEMGEMEEMGEKREKGEGMMEGGNVRKHAPRSVENWKRTRTGVLWDDVAKAVAAGHLKREDVVGGVFEDDNALLDEEVDLFLPTDTDETRQRKRWIRRIFDGWVGVAATKPGGEQVLEEISFGVLYQKYSQGLYHDRLFDFGYTAGFFMLFLVLGWFHFGLGWAVLGALLWFLVEERRREIRERKMHLMAMRAFRDLSFDDPIMKALLNIPNAVDKILPPWVQSPHIHRVEWLNIIVEKMWPYLHVAIEDAIVEKVTPLFEKRPDVIKEVGFASCDFGTIPFLLTGLEIHDSEAEDVLCDLDFRWAGNPDFAIWVKVKGMTLTVRITNFQLFGTFRVGLKPLMRQLPGFGAISVSFAKKPLIDFTLEAGKVNITHLPGVAPWITSFIRQQIVSNLVWPQKIIKEIYSTEEVERAYLNDHVPTGMVVIHVESAESLRKADLFSSDPYVALSIDGIIDAKKTSVIKRKTSPVWNETVEFPVPDITGKKLYLDVFDSDMGLNADDLLGRSEFDLYSLSPYLTVRVSEPLTLAKKGSISYSVRWVPFYGNAEYQPALAAESASEYAGFVFCHIKKATALPMGATMVTATLAVGMESCKTRQSSAANGNKPIWDEKHVLKVEDYRTDVLRIHLEHPVGKKKVEDVGVAKVQLASLAKRDYVEESSFLLEGVAQGAVHLRLIFTSVRELEDDVGVGGGGVGGGGGASSSGRSTPVRGSP